jgi:hypothetical protein
MLISRASCDIKIIRGSVWIAGKLRKCTIFNFYGKFCHVCFLDKRNRHFHLSGEGLSPSRFIGEKTLGES